MRICLQRPAAREIYGFATPGRSAEQRYRTTNQREDVTDGAAAFETIWSRGTLAQTFLTLAGSEVICTVLYSDLPEVADSS